MALHTIERDGMKERPIIFSGPMVRALLDGSKTQTRRVAPVARLRITPYGDGSVTWGVNFSKSIKGVLGSHSGGRLNEVQARRIIASQFCPYGQPGDRLWVRETWRGVVEINPPGKTTELGIARYVPDQEYCRRVEYRATQDRDGGPWRPSTHMPRWASRITLEVTGVRIENLQDISEADAIAEGIETNEYFARQEYFDCVAPAGSHGRPRPISEYQALWDSLNAARCPWVDSPYVWVVEFKRAQTSA